MLETQNVHYIVTHDPIEIFDTLTEDEAHLSEDVIAMYHQISQAVGSMMLTGEDIFEIIYNTINEIGIAAGEEILQDQQSPIRLAMGYVLERYDDLLHAITDNPIVYEDAYQAYRSVRQQLFIPLQINNDHFVSFDTALPMQ